MAKHSQFRSIRCSSSSVLSLSASTIVIEASDHPNKMGFKGVLVRLDEPSNKPPNGSEGHKILVPSSVAQTRLSTLIGMGLNYSKDLSGHAQQHKVGTIQKAWIDGKDLWVQGTIWKKDFPEAEKDLKRADLGMSMELSQVHVEDADADIWSLSDFYFTGATILKKSAAAYYHTQAIAAKADQRSYNMAVKKTTGKSTQSIAEIAAAAARKAIKAELGPITQILANLQARQEEQAIEIAAKHSEPDGDEAEVGEDVDNITTKKVDAEGEDVEARFAKKGDDEEPDGDEEDMEDEDDMESEGIDKGDLDEMGPGGSEDENDEPGAFNKGAKNMGSKTTADEKVGPSVNKAVTGAALKVLRRTVKAQQEQINKLTAAYSKLRKEHKQVARQASIAASQDTGRRSLSAELTAFLQKGGVDPGSLQASGEKISIAACDGILSTIEASAGTSLGPIKRMQIKNELLERGYLDEGKVTRQ